MHSPVPPRRILCHQAQHQGADRTKRAWPAPPAGPGHRSVAARNQITVPAQDRVGPHQQPQTVQGGSGQAVQQRGQPGPIGWVKPDALLAELAMQHRELVTQHEDLRVLVPSAARQQP